MEFQKTQNIYSSTGSEILYIYPKNRSNLKKNLTKWLANLHTANSRVIVLTLPLAAASSKRTFFCLCTLQKPRIFFRCWKKWANLIIYLSAHFISTYSRIITKFRNSSKIKTPRNYKSLEIRYFLMFCLLDYQLHTSVWHITLGQPRLREPASQVIPFTKRVSEEGNC